MSSVAKSQKQQNGAPVEAVTREAAFERLEKAADLWNGEAEDDLCAEYDRQIETYDQDANKVQWMGPTYVTEAVKKHLPSKDARILDVCGGTGLGGQLLRKSGYNNVDLLDGSVEMTIVAMKRGVYQTYIRTVLSETQPTCLASNVYDASLISGGHITEGKIREMLRIIKHGGLLIAGIVETTEIDRKEAEKVLAFIQSLGTSTCTLVEHGRVESMILRGDGSPAPGHVLVVRKK